MNDHVATLEDAICDVGYWRWWAEALPDVFQVEFGGVQLYTPPRSAAEPPSGVVALSFQRPPLIAFLTEAGPARVSGNWWEDLHQDRIKKGFSLNRELFTLRSEEMRSSIVTGCNVDFRAGDALQSPAEPAGALRAFRAQGVGLMVRAEAMSVISSAGELTGDAICTAVAQWWEYWREYWNRIDSESPMPKDYACEVTLPLKMA